MPRYAAPAVVVTLALMAGCASEVDLTSLRREQRELSRRLADTRADVESLRVSVSKLRGRLEEVGPGRSGSASADIERRLRALEDRAGEPPPVDVGEPAPGGAPPSTVRIEPSVPIEPAPPRAEPPKADETIDVGSDIAQGGADDYREGLRLYQEGDYSRAAQVLRNHVNKNPKSDVAPRAQYWIGEAYYAQGKYNEAILAYNEILVGWPKSDRVPAALLRQASAFAQLGDKIDARLILQKLISEHPNTEEAARAKRQLLALGT